jgi:8-oxo-dGTP diphosphatase
LAEQIKISREYPLYPLIGIGAIIVEDSRVVLIRRGKPPALGEWSIPGGLVKVGETLAEAVIREAQEETGLEVESIGLVELLERIFPDENGRIRHHYVLADYLCRVTKGKLCAGSDALEAAWVYREELQFYSLAPVTMRVVMKVLGKQ